MTMSHGFQGCREPQGVERPPDHAGKSALFVVRGDLVYARTLTVAELDVIRSSTQGDEDLQKIIESMILDPLGPPSKQGSITAHGIAEELGWKVPLGGEDSFRSIEAAMAAMALRSLREPRRTQCRAFFWEGDLCLGPTVGSGDSDER